MRIRFLFPALLIGLVACSSSPDESALRGADAASADAIPVSVADFMIGPSDLEASGPSVSFEVTNDGPTPHNLTIRDDADEVVMATQDLSVGESETISADLEPGTYTMFCSLAGHESLGMSGTLTVSGS
jgi:plastocyanin